MVQPLYPDAQPLEDLWKLGLVLVCRVRDRWVQPLPQSMLDEDREIFDFWCRLREVEY